MSPETILLAIEVAATVAFALSGVIAAGRNYGWPIITHGMNYDGTPITHLTARAGLEPPVTHWTPSIAVCARPAWPGAGYCSS